MTSIENLVIESMTFQNSRAVKIWQAIASIACVVAIVVAGFLIWQVLKDGKQCEAMRDGKNGGIQTGESRTEQPKFSLPCARQPSPLPLPDSVPGKLARALDKIKDLVKSAVNTTAQLPAISVNVFYQNRTLLSKHYGSNCYMKEVEPNDQTIYRIGSISKVFVVLMVYKFYEDGLIDSLDDPLSKYAPDFHIQNPFTERNVTIRQIASQMAGLPREAPCVYTCANATTQNQLEKLKNRSLVMTPGTMPSYSNLGYALLGRLLSENLLKNQTFEEWVIHHILRPLNMTRSGFNISDDLLKNLAYPHHRDGTRMPFMDIKWVAPSGQMYSTPEDMAKLGMMFIQPSKQTLFLPGSLREMMSPMSIAPDGVTLWGAPWEMALQENYLVRNKGGAIDSYLATFSVVPELQLGMSLFISSADFLVKRNFERDIFQILLPVFNETLIDLEDSAQFPVDLRPYIGNYTLTESNLLTLKPSTSSAQVVEKNSFLVVSYSLGNTSKQFEIHYVGNEFIFQARFAPPSFSCYRKRLGFYEDLHFLPFNGDGLSPGFNVPGSLIIATRVF